MMFPAKNPHRLRCCAVSVAVGIASAALAGAPVEYQKLLAGDGETPDQFGASVATYDGRMIVGSKYANFDLVLDCGAAYVWNRISETEWEEEAKLTAPDAVSGDVFGIAVGIGEDYALVGAYYDDITAGNDRAGAVYAYTRAMDGTWSFHEKFNAPGAVGGETFGCSIGVDGDVAIIGAAGFNVGPAQMGAAHIYRRDMAGDWIHEQTLAPTDPQMDDDFGWSVDIEGDTAVVGAWNNDAGLGAAYVYTRDAMTGVWDSGVKITADSRIAGERLGWSVSISGDTFLAGATQEGTGGTGAAYVFQSDGLGGWAQEDRLVGAEAIANQQVGRAVELSGEHAMIGALEAGFFPTVGDNGSVYVFRRSGAAWSQIDRIRANDGQGDDQFGAAVATDAGLLLVGARAEDEFGFNAGAAYIIDTHDLLCPADVNGDRVVDAADLGVLIGAFGSAGPAGDINGDGIVDAADLGLLIAAFGSACD